MDRYLPPIVKDNLPPQIIVLAGYAWAGLMFALGLANLYVAANYSPLIWGYFLSIGATGAKIVAFFTQYLVFQILVRRRLRAQALLLRGPLGNPQTDG
jgi:intracellular septation protein